MLLQGWNNCPIAFPMKFLLLKIAKLKCGWNETQLDETVFYKLCRRHSVVVQEMPLRVSGFYYSVMGRHFIAVDSRLEPRQKLFVLFHEFGHFLFHSPDDGTTANFHGVGKRTRKEAEADAFALCALIPKLWVEERTPGELIDDEGFPSEMVRERFELFKRHGI